MRVYAVVDCIYFAMVTMTTVGYGDMPTLRQEMRLFTLFFGFVGVTVVAGSINVHRATKPSCRLPTLKSEQSITRIAAVEMELLLL